MQFLCVDVAADASFASKPESETPRGVKAPTRKTSRRDGEVGLLMLFLMHLSCRAKDHAEQVFKSTSNDNRHNTVESLEAAATFKSDKRASLGIAAFRAGRCPVSVIAIEVLYASPRYGRAWLRTRHPRRL